VVVAGRNEERGEAVASEIGGVFHRTDVRRVTECKALARCALDEFGRIDVLVNSAGILPLGSVVDVTEEGFDEARAWSRGFWDAMEPYHTGVYTNFLMEEGEDRIRQAYGAAKYDRLKALKRHYDPDNLFHRNQNIPPN